MSRELLPLLAFVWLGMLLFAALGGYAFGWWWRGRHEAGRRVEYDRQLWREWEWNHRLKEQERPEPGPPNLRVVE